MQRLIRHECGSGNQQEERGTEVSVGRFEVTSRSVFLLPSVDIFFLAFIFLLCFSKRG